MKLTYTFLGFCLLALTFFSCSDDIIDPSLQESNLEANLELREGCCDVGVDVDIVTVQNANGCCTYEVTISNPTSCDLFVLNELGARVFSVGSFQNRIFTHTVCFSESGPECEVFTITPSINEPPCTAFELCSYCPEDCCDGLKVDYELVGTDQKACGDNYGCVYVITYSNYSDCDLFLYGDKDNVRGTLFAGQSGTITITRCAGDPDHLLYHYIGVNPDRTEACKELNLEDC